MKKTFFLTTLVAVCLGLFAFSSIKDPLRFSMTKGPCYGFCPEYTVEIYESQTMIFKGKKNTAKIGIYQKMLTRSQYLEIKNAFEVADFGSFKDYYDSRVPDRPTVTITYHRIGKTVTGKESRPNAVLKIEEMLARYAESKDGWQSLEKDTPKSAKLVVLVNEKVNINKLVGMYSQYDLKVVEEKLIPKGNYYVLSFNTGKIASKKMVQVLTERQGVLSVELHEDKAIIQK